VPFDPIALFIAWLQAGGIFQLIGLIIAWIIIFIISSITTRLIRRRITRSGVPPDAVNGLILALRLVFIYIAVWVLFMVLPPEISGAAVGAIGGSSLLLGTAIGLSVGQAVRNLVSGLYVMVARPFHVRDYVRIGNTEGIVQEISFNYTKILQIDETSILVPNSTVLDSSVTNFSVDKEKFQVEVSEALQDDAVRLSVLDKVASVLGTKKIIRYVFILAFHTSQNVDRLASAFDTVCQRWTDTFGFRPLYEITDIQNLSFVYQFTIFVDRPRKILEHKAGFLDDILHTVFAEPKT
jgi:small-conductance mechanosensitive channel